ncbi:hypothetical protein PTKIN_Ptkin02bG0121000 [Pterospermum kingtungense]
MMRIYFGKDWTKLFANVNWLESHENVQLLNLPVLFSDHGPMILFSQAEQPFVRRLYRFEVMWNLHLECKKVIKKS